MSRLRMLVTALDALALLLVAAGVAVALWPVAGGAALIAAGAVVGAGSAYADRDASGP